jgi:glycosyltransferase involved in cell wall biosynthesis
LINIQVKFGDNILLVIVGSLDSTLNRAQFQGNLSAIVQDYKLFESFDSVTLLTQDTVDFSMYLSGIKHVPCSQSKSKVKTMIISKFSLFRWFNVYVNSFLWLLKRRSQITTVISENVDSPIPLIFSSLFKIPYFIRYNYDVSTQIKEVNKRFFEGLMLLVFEKIAFKRASSVWVMAPHLKEKAECLGAKKTRFIPNWISVKDNQVKKVQLPKENAKIIFVGRLHPVKRVPLLVEAFTLLLKDFPSATLTLVGDGTEREHIEEIVKKNYLSEKVNLIGFKNHDEVLEIMRDADLIVLPSRMEGNPRVLVEAMMIGLPVVATNVIGIKDMIKNQETGYLVKEATPEALREGMRYVLNNKDFSSKIAAAGRQFALSEFSKEQVLNKVSADIHEYFGK